VARGHIPNGRPQLGDSFAGQTVEDVISLAPRTRKARPSEQAQVVRRAGDALPDLGGDILNRTLTLSEKIDDLGAPSTSKRPGH
jgi:hypothetical protein